MSPQLAADALTGQPHLRPKGASLRRHLLALVLSAVLLQVGCGTAATAPRTGTGDQVFATAFEQRQSGIQVGGAGTVARVLADDDDGGRHQRFILALASGQTLLVAHNIDVAPRIPTLAAGDTVEFFGVYEWNEQGGVVHWTHHDPDGRHEAGWLKHRGTVYR